MTQPKLKWGIMGCAGIAQGAVIPGIHASQTGEVVAIASRHLEKAQQTAQKWNIPIAYGSYEELLADSQIDAVYIPLPNHLHKPWTIKAAQAGKHVLCEKPAALNARETQEMVIACHQAGVQWAEAFMYRHHPRYQLMKDVIRSGEIGTLRGIHSNFTFNSSSNKGNFRFDRSMGGGSIYDVGVYPISAARFILEDEPEAVTVHALFSPEHGDVDMMASGLIEFPDGMSLTFDCGMWGYYRNELEILGTQGRIVVPSAYVDPRDAGSNFYIQTDQGKRDVEVPQVNQFALEVDDLAYAVWGQKPLHFSASDAVMNMRVVDACLRSARERCRVVLY
jgi:xylose dehydrogenase (NAD/NADP)